MVLEIGGETKQSEATDMVTCWLNREKSAETIVPAKSR